MMPVGPTTVNPILEEIDRAHASLSPAAQESLKQAGAIMGQKQGAQPAAPEGGQPLAPIAGGAGGMIGSLPMRTPPIGPAPTSTEASAPAETQPIAAPSTMTPARTRLADLQQNGAGVDRIKHGIARIPLQIGDALLGGLFPGIEQRLPGTAGHHLVQTLQAEKAVGDEDAQAAADAKQRLTTAQATEAESLPALHQSQLEAGAAKETGRRETEAAKDETKRAIAEGVAGTAAAKNEGTVATEKAKHAATLASHGFKEDEHGQIVPLSYEEMSESQQAVHDLKAAQSEAASASADLKKAQAANQPTMIALAQKRLASAAEAHGIAARRLGLSEAQFEMRSHGTSGGEALPGAMLNDQGTPVGTAFQQNVRPTGQERNKADLANSAHEQLQDIKSIVAKRPDIFGPLAGRKTDFTVWLGSQDPDAQAFRAARTIAGDHLAGVFGGRSEAALKALDDAIGHFKDNPKAMQAGLDQLDKANKTFQKAGTVHTAGSSTDTSHAPAVHMIEVDGKRYEYSGKGATDDMNNYTEVKKK